MVITIISCLIVAIVFFIIGYKIPGSKNNEAKLELKHLNEQLDNISSLVDTEQHLKDSITEECYQAKTKLAELQSKQVNLEVELHTASTNLMNLRRATKEAKDYQQELLETESERYKLALQQIKFENQAFLDSYDKDLEENMIELSGIFEKRFSQILEEADKYDQMLAEAKRVADLAIEAQRRDYEKAQEKEFYKIKLSQQDISEIHRLKEITAELRNPEVLNKVIWRVYYQNPLGDLINRVLGKEKRCGIYRITNILNGMTYIGQSVNVADRWNQHVKRGLGAEPTTRNKLYPAMAEAGPENFTFELLEECPREQLNEREKFWIEYYHGQDFGYNETAGG